MKINTKLLREENTKIKERKTINTLMILEQQIWWIIYVNGLKDKGKSKKLMIWGVSWLMINF